MKIAVAAMASDVDSEIAKQSARAPFYLLFDKQGGMLEAISNPFAEVDRGAAPQAAVLLANKEVTLLVAVRSRVNISQKAESVYSWQES